MTLTTALKYKDWDGRLFLNSPIQYWTWHLREVENPPSGSVQYMRVYQRFMDQITEDRLKWEGQEV